MALLDLLRSPGSARIKRAGLKPFWQYYGGKWRAAPHYPKPEYRTIIEPFAGAAGYSMRYPDRDVVLIEKYARVAEIWRYLISVPEAEIRRIPLVEAVADLPTWVPAGGKDLVGFLLNFATTSPRTVLSRTLKNSGYGWTEDRRERIASQLHAIRHWRIIEGEYADAPSVPATWFIDPPYANAAGRHYAHCDLNYADLAVWCKSRIGQVIVCENEGASWLPFRTLGAFKAGPARKTSAEVIWP